jgi:presenilin-like A22 family membrane protease
MKINKPARLNPIYWSLIIFIVAQIITFSVIARENTFLNNKQIYVPTQPAQIVTVWPQTTTSPSGQVTTTPAYSSLGPILIYFFSVVVILGVVLFLVPVSILRLLLKALFAFLFGWGIFIILVLWLPLAATVPIALAVGLAWFFFPRIWLHNLALVLALSAVGAVFGRFISPWTAMILLAALAVYDFLAVRFGYMLWMAKKLSDSNTLPAFIIPRGISDWNSSLKKSSVAKIAEETPAERKYSILGGGDIGFPLLLMSSVYFARGLTGAMIIAAFTILGLMGAYWIQAVFLKGKPMPALPPIAVMSLIGLIIVTVLSL